MDYHPAYRSEGGTHKKAHLLCRQLQKAALHHASARPPAEVADMVAIGIAGLARAFGWKSPNNRPITAHNVWATLTHRDPQLPRRLRRLLRDHVLAGDAVWKEGAWLAFLGALLPLFGPQPREAAGDIAAHRAFVAEQEASPTDPEHRSTKQVQLGDITLRLGSIHSVKGKSVDGILVVESELWKGTASKDQCMDLTMVLPHAFGITDQTFSGVGLTAATNVFVAVTRPRELLGLAMRKLTATAPLLIAAEAQGWKVVDLDRNSPERI